MSRREILHEVLPNGLTVLLRESHAAPVAEVQVWAQVGSADEREGESGLAHFHEHMLFKGTDRRGVGEVAGDVEGVGGRINAYTTYDVTVYHATLPSDRLGVGLDVLADAVRFSTFDEAEIRREVEVVLEEIRRSEDSPHHVLGNALFAEAYRVHPYRSPILGSSESVASFDRERVRSFYRSWYSPENLMVVAAGDFDADALMARVSDAFGEAEPGTTRRLRPVEPDPTELRTCLVRGPFERASVELAFPGVAFNHPDAPHLDLLAFILGEGDSSRLVVRVKEKQGLCDRIDAGSYTPLDRGLFGVNVDLETSVAPAALEAIVRETERLRREPVADDELEKARANFLAQEHFERESVSGMARKLGSFQAIAGDWRREDVYMDAIRTATAEDLERVARIHLDPQKLCVGAVLPQEANGLDHATIESAVSRGVEANLRLFTPPRRRPEGDHIVSFELSNGIQLHVLPRREIPVVAARAAGLGGQLAETAETAGLSSFLAAMWLRGTKNRSSTGLARAIESLAADIDGFSGRNSMGLTFEVAREKLEPTLDLFAEVLLEPAFDPDELERERRDVLAAIERREDRLGARCFDLFAETHFETHPYRLPLVGTAESVGSFDVERVAAHHGRLVRSSNLVLAVAGDVDPEEMATSLQSRLADLGGEPFQLETPLEPPPRERRFGELRKDRAQSHLVLGFRGLTVDDADREALEVIAQLLAGQGGRLFLELRDKRSLAYTVTAVNVEGVAPGFFALYIASAPEKFEAAKRGMEEEIERLLAGPPPADELERAKRHLIGNFAIDEQRCSSRAAHAALDALYGLGPDVHDRYPQRLEAVTAEDVLRVARRVIDLETSTLAVVR